MENKKIAGSAAGEAGSKNASDRDIKNSKGRKNVAKSTRDLALLALFVAIIFLLTFTPIGFINLVVIKATIVHIPVIIGSVLLGPKKGAVLGATFGLASLIANTMTPSLLSFAFSPAIPIPGFSSGSAWALFVCFVPRILVGIVPFFVFRACGRRRFALALAGILGSLTNTVLVMGSIFFIFKDAYAQIKNVTADAVLPLILGVIGTNGVPEAACAAVLTTIVCIPLLKLFYRKGERI